MHPLSAVTFGEDGGFACYTCTGLVQNHTHSLQRGARADDIINDQNFFTRDQLAVFFIKNQNLRLARSNGKGFRLKSIAHVWLVLLAENNVRLFRFH